MYSSKHAFIKYHCFSDNPLNQLYFLIINHRRLFQKLPILFLQRLILKNSVRILQKQIQIIINGNIRTRLKKCMVQVYADNIMSVMNEINYNYDRINNKGIILLLESLRIDTTPKIESLTIKLKNINQNEIRKYIFL